MLPITLAPAQLPFYMKMLGALDCSDGAVFRLEDAAAQLLQQV